MENDKKMGQNEKIRCEVGWNPLKRRIKEYKKLKLKQKENVKKRQINKKLVSIIKKYFKF